MLKVPAVVVLLFTAASSETCKENAVVGHCLFKGCFMGHGKATCHGTNCVCDPGTCSVDGHRCVQKPSPLQAGKVVKFFKADGANMNRWLGFSANDARFARRQHALRFTESYDEAMPARLFDAKSVWMRSYPRFARTLAKDTFCLRNVYGHGYAPYWVGPQGGARSVVLRASYKVVGQRVPIEFVKVGCNKYKLQIFYTLANGAWGRRFVKQRPGAWGRIDGSADFAHGVVVSVWGVGEQFDECGDPLPVPGALAEAEPAVPPSAAAALGLLGASATGLIIAAVVTLRRLRAAPELKQPLLVA